MARVKVEFINTCAHCAAHEQAIKKAAARYGDDVEVRFYYAGKDFDYLNKYGMITRGTMIINERKKFENLSRRIIEKAIEEAMGDSPG